MTSVRSLEEDRIVKLIQGKMNSERANGAEERFRAMLAEFELRVGTDNLPPKVLSGLEELAWLHQIAPDMAKAIEKTVFFLAEKINS